MTKAAPEHFEMAATAFHSVGRLIDPELCEAFADILARESAGHSAVVKELNDIKRAAISAFIPSFKKGG